MITTFAVLVLVAAHFSAAFSLFVAWAADETKDVLQAMYCLMFAVALFLYVTGFLSLT